MRLYLLTIGRLNYFLVGYAISYRKQRLNIRLSLKRSLLSWWQNLHQFSFRSSWRPRITWQDVYRANVFRLHDYALSSRTGGRNRTGRAMSRNFPDRRRKENKSANKSCGTLDGHAPPQASRATWHGEVAATCEPHCHSTETTHILYLKARSRHTTRGWRSRGLSSREILRLNSTTRARPDPHGLCRRPARTQRSFSGRPGPQKSPCGSGRARVVEFSYYAANSHTYYY